MVILNRYKSHFLTSKKEKEKEKKGFYLLLILGFKKEQFFNFNCIFPKFCRSMASSISRRLCRTLLYTNPKLKPFNFSCSFCSKTLSSPETSESDEPTALHSVDSDTDAESPGPFSSSSNSTNQQRVVQSRPLENGLDVGIYKV